MPQRIGATFDQPRPSAAGRNEIRAVYGGFGVAIAVLLAVAPSSPRRAPGALLAVAVALAGMAAGRLVSAAVERPDRFDPSWFYFVLESAIAAVLLAASGAWG
jgi:hypothetical protein